MLNPTEEQMLIIEAARDKSKSLMVQALAGTGKTSTIQMIMEETPREPTIALAFNKKNKEDLEKRLPPEGLTVKTFNGLGHAAWGAAIGSRVGVNDKKLGEVLNLQARAQRIELGENWATVKDLISKAMLAGIVPSVFHFKGITPDTVEGWQSVADDHLLDLPSEMFGLARDTLIECIKRAFPINNAPEITFDEQIYLSTMLGGKFQKYPRVVVDEAQDLNVLNHIQVAKSSSDRLVVVGDDRQAIYAFRGADTSSMAKLKALKTDWHILPLNLTFRCPKAVVSRQQVHVPGYRPHEQNPTGLVMEIIDKWSWPDITSLPAAGNKVAVLCRNNAPLVSLTMKLLSQRIGCIMLGRDIGKGLQALAKKVLKGDRLDPTDSVRRLLAYKKEQIDIALANGNERKAEGIGDRVDCLLAILDSDFKPFTQQGLQNTLANLFGEENGVVTLSTGHKAKGLEWDIVVHLDHWRIPSKYAQTNPSALAQEMNLKYVIETRAKHTLVLASLEKFQ